MIKGKIEKNRDCELEVGGEKLTLKPLPLKKFKEVVKAIVAVMDTFAKNSTIPTMDFVKQLPDIIISNFEKVLPHIIDAKVNPHMTQEWVEEHVTVPEMEEIVTCTYHINGVGDFLERLRTGFGTTTPATSPAPSSSDGSSTSSASATDGASEKPKI